MDVEVGWCSPRVSKTMSDEQGKGEDARLTMPQVLADSSGAVHATRHLFLALLGYRTAVADAASSHPPPPSIGVGRPDIQQIHAISPVSWDKP